MPNKRSASGFNRRPQRKIPSKSLAPASIAASEIPSTAQARIAAPSSHGEPPSHSKHPKACASVKASSVCRWLADRIRFESLVTTCPGEWTTRFELSHVLTVSGSPVSRVFAAARLAARSALAFSSASAAARVALQSRIEVRPGVHCRERGVNQGAPKNAPKRILKGAVAPWAISPTGSTTAALMMPALPLLASSAMCWAQ